MEERQRHLKGVDIFVLMDNEVESGQFQKEGGLSIMVRAHYPEGDLDILFDTAITGERVLSNMEKMNLDLSNTCQIILSHKHFDHTGGLLEILRAKDDWIPIIHGKNFFRPSIAVEPYLKHITKMPFLKEKIVELKGMLTPIWRPIEFAPGIFVSGRIPLVTDFEAPIPPLFRMILPEMVQDEIEEELSLVVNLGEELIVISGCSHRGIVNIVRNAISVTQVPNVKAIIGGLHLVAVSQERIARTTEELAQLGVKEFYIGHCTGDSAIEQFKSTFGDAVRRTRSGMYVTF
jgi:7,8-dihydropterin-6-yl-methyl-4-(beta-D-ribofuranosyl)aminobenzene 5'-phosphate synthase